jgi:ATP-dependent Clp protease protease subunit
MRHNRLLQLLADNRATSGRRFEIKTAAESSDEAEVFLYDAIVDTDAEAQWWGGVSAQAFVRELRGITASTIHLRINSPGGSVFAGRAMETALREHKARVVVHIDGLAASAATFVAMAGDEIVIAQGAMFMIHKAWTWTWGNADDLKATADLLDKIDGTLVQTYAKRTGQAEQQVSDWMAAETWFTAQEALDAGFVDRILEDEEAGDTAAEASTGKPAWNLSAFLARVSRPAAGPAPAPDAQPDPVQPDPDRTRQQQRLRALQLTAPIA